MTSTRPKSPLCESAARAGTSSRIALARQQLEPRPLELVDHRRRDADVGDHEIAAVGVGGRQDQRNLRRRQRHRHRRLDRLPVELVRVRRHAGRQIDGDDRHAEPVDVGDDRLEQAGQRPVEAGADDRVDDQVALGDLAEVQLPLLRVGDLHDGEADAAEDLEVDARVAADVADAAEQEHRRLDAALRQRPRDDEAVAAVVAAAAQHARPCWWRDPRTPPPSPRPPAGRRSPSARSTACRCRRSSGGRPRASAACSELACSHGSSVCCSRLRSQSQFSGRSCDSGSTDLTCDARSGLRQREDRAGRPGGGAGLRSWVRLRRGGLRDASHLQPASRSSTTGTCGGCAQSARPLCSRRAVRRRRRCCAWIATRWRAGCRRARRRPTSASCSRAASAI